MNETLHDILAMQPQETKRQRVNRHKDEQGTALLAPGFRRVDFLPAQFRGHVPPRTIAEPFPLPAGLTYADGAPIKAFRVTYSVNLPSKTPSRLFAVRKGNELFIFAHMTDDYAVFVALCMAQYEPGFVVSEPGQPIKALYLLGGVK